jgi:O-antigen ligase
LRCVFFVAALAAIFLSGFRATILSAMVFFALATLLRRRGQDIVVAGGVSLLGLVFLILLQGSVVQLPLTMQRTLSWLPGDWNQEVVDNAEGSSRWRYEMVEWAWNDTTVLRNKIWGQGIGFTIDDMNLIASMLIAGQGSANLLGGSDRENFMITGTFHNGPISAIKCVGIVGLVLYSVLICYLAVRAWKLCVLTTGTRAFPLALFVGMPVIYFPFQFLVLTGFYELDLTGSVFAAGLLNLVSSYHRNVVSKANVSV